MKPSKTTKPKYQSIEVDGPLPFRMFAAGEGQVGGGRLVFDGSEVRVILKPEAAWNDVNSGRKGSSSFKNKDGSWVLEFLFCRALIYSQVSLVEAQRGMKPVTGEGEVAEKTAANQIARASKAMALASDARMHALKEAAKIGVQIPNKAVLTERGFIDWFKVWLGERATVELVKGQFTFMSFIEGCIRAVTKLDPTGYSGEVLDFRKALAGQAKKEGGPPTKESVRLAMGGIIADREAKRWRFNPDQPKGEGEQKPKGWTVGKEPIFKGATDLVDPKDFSRLLVLTGFSWLPGGTPGPKSR